MKAVLFIEVTAPCATYCVCVNCEASWVIIRCQACADRAADRGIRVTIQHYQLGPRKTYKRNKLSLLLGHTVLLGTSGKTLPLIFTNNAVQSPWVIHFLCSNSRIPSRAARQFQYVWEEVLRACRSVTSVRGGTTVFSDFCIRWRVMVQKCPYFMSDMLDPENKGVNVKAIPKSQQAFLAFWVSWGPRSLGVASLGWSSFSSVLSL